MQTAVTEKIKLGVAYIRESTKEQDKGYSPENQLNTINKFASENNIKITKTYKDLVSGTTVEKRDNFLEMIDDAGKKKFQVVIVFHTSRFARNVAEAKKYKKLLRTKLRVDVVSATQHFGDWDDPSSFLNESINEVFDEYTSRNISFWVRTNLRAKRSQGKQLGNPPLGYYKKRTGYDEERERPIYSQKWQVDKKEAVLVKKIFQMYASGNYSYADIAVEINKTGTKTKYGNPFTYSSIKDILKNKSYLGYVFSPRKDYPTIKGSHKPILTKELFYKVENMIKERRGNKGRPISQHRFYLLQDLVYCHHCIKHIKGKEEDVNARMLPKMYCQAFIGDKKEYYTYACKFRKENKTCKQENVKCEIIDKQVLKFMEGFNLPEDIIQLTIDKLKTGLKESKPQPNEEVKRIKFLNELKRKVNFKYENTNEYTDQEYIIRINEIDQELKKFDTTQENQESHSTYDLQQYYLKETEKFLRNFNQIWGKIDDKEKRAWIKMTIKRVWVKNKKVVAIEPRDEYKGLFSVHKKVLGQSPLATHSKTCLILGMFFVDTDGTYNFYNKKNR